MEAGELCLVSCLFGKNNNFSSELRPEKDLTHLCLACRFLKEHGLQPKIMESEQHARDYFMKINPSSNTWPLFFKSDTTGEKAYEEFLEIMSTLIALITFDCENEQVILKSQLQKFKNNFEKLQKIIFLNAMHISLIAELCLIFTT